MSSNNELEKFLSLIPVNPNAIQKIVERFGDSIEEFYANNQRWALLFGLNEEEVIKLLKSFSVLERAKIDCQSYSVLNKNFPYKYPDDVESFYNQHQEEIENEYGNISKESIKQIYKLAYDRYFSQSHSLILRGICQAVPFIQGIIQKLPFLFDLVKANPNISTGLFSCMDEVVSFFTDISFGQVSRLNIYGEFAIFGMMTVYSMGVHFFEWKRGVISGKQFWTYVAVDTVANASVCVTSLTAAVACSFIGSCIFPGVGTLLGSIIGSLGGGIFAKKYIEPEVRRYLATSTIDIKSVEQASTEELYLKALEKLNVYTDTPTELIKKSRHDYLMALHPDKTRDGSDELSKEKTKRLITLEANYKIIENYRKANNTW